eukprot:1158805-Pelagomonas_calceolata.AAC.5
MRCLSLDAPCHDGLDLSQCFNAGAFLWGATGAASVHVGKLPITRSPDVYFRAKRAAVPWIFGPQPPASG